MERLTTALSQLARLHSHALSICKGIYGLTWVVNLFGAKEKVVARHSLESAIGNVMRLFTMLRGFLLANTIPSLSSDVTLY